MTEGALRRSIVDEAVKRMKANAKPKKARKGALGRMNCWRVPDRPNTCIISLFRNPDSY